MSDLFNSIISKIVSILPNDPFYDYINNLNLSLINSNWIHWLNWFIPIGDLLNIFGLWIVAVLGYQIVKLFISGFSSFKGFL